MRVIEYVVVRAFGSVVVEAYAHIRNSSVADFMVCGLYLTTRVLTQWNWVDVTVWLGLEVFV